MTKELYDAQGAILVDQLNALTSARPEELAILSEERYNQQMRSACGHISQNLTHAHIVLLAGPSASGKTVTAHRFRTMLKEEFGINSFVVSLDDFYINQSNLPVLPDGSRDLETIYALDIECIHQCFKELTNTGRASLPTFDFMTASRSTATNEIILGDSDILIVEGIHALNPLITEGNDPSRFLRLYISVCGEYRLGEDIVLNHVDLRFIRRCVRDFWHRASTLEQTAKMWRSVRDGEKRYISPYKQRADLTIDSLILYEPCIFHHYINPLIQAMDTGDEAYPRFERIYRALSLFRELDKKYIAGNSLLREFID